VKAVVFSCSEYEAKNYGKLSTFPMDGQLLTVAIRSLFTGDIDGSLEMGAR
jgi:hypothetical protein